MTRTVSSRTKNHKGTVSLYNGHVLIIRRRYGNPSMRRNIIEYWRGMYQNFEKLSVVIRPDED